MLSENPTMEELEAFFGNDRFAMDAAQCKIIEGSKGHGVAEMEIQSIHQNAQGHVMGGAIFTLADFALAIACNVGQDPSVNLSSSIEYIKSTKGSKLIATADCVKDGRRVAFYDVVVADDLGELIVKVSVVAYRHVPAK